MNKTVLLLTLSMMKLHCFSQLGAGLVSQYYFSGSANDMVGSNHGIVRGATLAPDRFGNTNSAYCFDGQSNLINLGTSNSLKSGTMSISFWAKITGTTVNSNAYSNHPFIFTKATNLGAAYEAYFVGVFKFTDEIDAATSDMNGWQTVSFSGVTASQNVWNHIVYMFTHDSTYLFVNNILTNQLYKGHSSTYLQGDSVVLGFVGNIPVPGNTYSYLNGCLDDFRIYNRLLNHNEIQQLYLEARPTADYSFAGNACRGATITFTDNSTHAPTSWAWSVSPNNGVTINTSSSQNPQMIFANIGTYTISLQVTNAIGSSGIVTKTISVSPCTGINEALNGFSHINILPNPTSGTVKLQNIKNEIPNLILRNNLGLIVKTFESEQLKELDFEFDLGDLPKGVYFMEVRYFEDVMVRKILFE